MFKYENRSRRHSAILLPLALGLVLMGMSGIVAAMKPDDVTESEKQLWPRYCPDTEDYSPRTSPGYINRLSQMGVSFKGMHHYCWAFINMLHARKAGLPAKDRIQLFQSARSEYVYVIRNSTKDFVLLPEIYTRLGEVELLLKKPNNANAAFAQARQLKPDYWPAYSHWAEYLIRSGKKAEAKELLQTGLEYSPTAKVLIEQYRMVGGKPSDIVARVPDPDPESVIPPTTPAEDKSTPKSTFETPPDAKPVEQ